MRLAVFSATNAARHSVAEPGRTTRLFDLSAALFFGDVAALAIVDAMPTVDETAFEYLFFESFLAVLDAREHHNSDWPEV